MQYAREIVDVKLGTSFAQFMNIYLKQKYAKQPLNASEQQYVSGFLGGFMRSAKKHIPFKQRMRGFLSPSRSLTFFVKPGNEPDDEE